MMDQPFHVIVQTVQIRIGAIRKRPREDFIRRLAGEILSFSRRRRLR